MSHSKLFFELGDLEITRKLLFNFDLIESSLFDENDKRKNKKSQKAVLTTFLYHLENKKPVSYSHANGKKSGRVYSKGGIQFLKRELRNAIMNNYIDIDMKNAQPTCLLSWCENIGMNVDVLKEYCVNREKYYHLKQEIIEILYGGGLPDFENRFPDDLEFLLKFKKETQIIWNMMMNRIENKQKITNLKKKKDTNIEGSLCAEILQELENKCLQSALGFLVEQGVPIENFVLMFDGFMANSFDLDLLVGLNEYVFKQTGIPAIYVKKEMTDIFVIPADWGYDPKELKQREINAWYLREKETFELLNCRIEQPLQYLYQNTDNSIYLFAKNELLEKYSEINYKGTYFSKLWMDDPKKKKFVKIDFLPPPKICPTNVYNLWSGFECEKNDDPESENTSGIDTFKKIIGIMSGNNLEMETFIANIIAHIIQRPAEQLPISLVLCGLEGTGKNVFADILQKLIGRKYCFETADLENEVFCRFKSNVMNKLLLLVNEADPNETFKYEQKLKNWIGNGKFQSFEGKGTKAIDLEIFFFILFITNNMFNPVNITPTDRRYVLTETSNDFRCNELFWGNVVHIFNKPENIKGIFNYFSKYIITVKSWSAERPMTKLYNNVKSVCFDKIIKGLRSLILFDWDSTENERWFDNNTLYKLFNITKTDENSFGSKLGTKNITGIKPQRTHSGRGWTIDKTETFEWLKSNKFIFNGEKLTICEFKGED